jgi:hypothetical protein
MDSVVMEQAAARRDLPAGYTLVLPPGWRQIPVRQGTRKVIRQIVGDAFRDLPKRVSRDRVTPYRIELDRRLTAAADNARQHGGTELYLPVEMVHGRMIAASFVVSEGSLSASPGSGPADVASCLAAGTLSSQPDESATSVTVDGALAIRAEHTAPPNEDGGVDYGSRHAAYTIAVPGSVERWLLFAFSALGAGDPDDNLAKLLVELFDAIMSTFRWTRHEITGTSPE